MYNMIVLMPIVDEKQTGWRDMMREAAALEEVLPPTIFRPQIVQTSDKSEV